MENELKIINTEEIKNLIYTIRGKEVMLDSDVAMLYHYETKNVNKAMKRNIERFPEDFCFQLTDDEFKNLRFQFGTLNKKVNNGKVTRKYLPYVYTEQGILMLAGVLKNDIAVQVSISIIRAFIEMRKFISSNSQIFERLTKNSEVLILLSFDIFYLLLNCGALRAFLRPYFFLSFIRGSLVKNPFDFKAGLYS